VTSPLRDPVVRLPARRVLLLVAFLVVVFWFARPVLLPFAVATAIAYAFTAALIKTVSNYAATDWVTMLYHWQTYGVVVFGLLGLFLTQNAFHAGPLAASQSTLVLVDPLVSICLGIVLYGDSLRTSGWYGPLEALSLLVMFMGAVFLSNSPLITGMKGEGKGVEYDEMLSRRLKSHAPA